MRMIVGLVAASLFAFAAMAEEQNYPSRPIRILVPYAAGGVSDIAARLVGQKLTDTLGQSVIVDNRPGGNGFIAVTAAVRAPADGHTLIVGTVGEFTINPALYKDIPYDVERDLTPVAMLSDTPLVLVANVTSPYHSVEDVIAAAKAKPETLGISSPGAGTFNHITIAQFELRAGIRLVHVPYRGGAPAAAAVAAGDVPLSVLAISSAVPFLQSGRIRVLAVTTAKRSSFNSDWKTLQEEGVADIDASNWVGMLAPKGVPKPIIERLHDEIQIILAMPDIKERFAAGGADTVPMSIADFDARIKADTLRFKTIVTQAGLHAE
ncbi:MAG: tripartite tricarboxylate transporter substrate binding protein, partial [Bradyrhizobiaceae bacterium]|nr:tripartite tricarboxylate transporter substrate binding protein [Bradyrhizobiaceae bacterium]